jgi:glycerophosphoryl diester phosphodiesterase
VKAWALAYTVNDEAEAQRLWSMGLDALITDRVDLFSPEG